jgi:hypothetical protein
MRHLRSVKRFVGKLVAFVVLATLALVLFGFVAMSLWNWLMPALFGLKTVTFWQAVGLLMLARLLLGSFRGSHGGSFRGRQWRMRMLERWEQMTPEEREAFRAGLRGRSGRETFSASLGGRSRRCAPPPPAEQPTA